MTPQEIKRIRKEVLNLTQREACTLFGLGHNAITRFENGESNPPKTLAMLLELASKHPKIFFELCPK